MRHNQLVTQLLEATQLHRELTPEGVAAFVNILEEKELPAKTVLITPQKIAQVLYFIGKGGVRSYCLVDGVDVSDYFFLEGDFVTEYASFYTNKPSIGYLETIEHSTVLFTTRNKLLRLYQTHPETQLFGRRLAEAAFVAVEERTRLLHQTSLETRLEWLLEQIPTLFQRVPQYHIASYLGVRPESLSRIKRQLFQKKKNA
jgi:CRP-like cAMP-binding protein